MFAHLIYMSTDRATLYSSDNFVNFCCQNIIQLLVQKGVLRMSANFIIFLLFIIYQIIDMQSSGPGVKSSVDYQPMGRGML